jgi:hypothetical protein
VILGIPPVCGPQDRKRAAVMYDRGIDLATVPSAMLLASVHRLGRPPAMPALNPIRSLAYFMPVIEELLANPIPRNRPSGAGGLARNAGDVLVRDLIGPLPFVPGGEHFQKLAPKLPAAVIIDGLIKSRSRPRFEQMIENLLGSSIAEYHAPLPCSIGSQSNSFQLLIQNLRSAREVEGHPLAQDRGITGHQFAENLQRLPGGIFAMDDESQTPARKQGLNCFGKKWCPGDVPEHPA